MKALFIFDLSLLIFYWLILTRLPIVQRGMKVAQLVLH